MIKGQDVSDFTPIYKKISNSLRYQIENGNYPDGERLPSVRSLSNQFSVSITTAQRALCELQDEGIVYSIPKSGYYIKNRSEKTNKFWTQFPSVEINVNKDIVTMLSIISENSKSQISSAILGREMIPDVLLRRCLSAIVKQDQESSAEYVPPPGYSRLRRHIVRLMAERGVMCAADDIIITSGDSIAMELALWATGEPEGLVIIEEPTYFGILLAIEQAGFRAVSIATDSKTGIKLDHVEAVLKQRKVSAIFLNPTLHNPSGYTMPATNRRDLVKMARRYGVAIIEDDVFADLHPPSNRPPAIKHYDEDGSVVYCSSFSKVISPGYRVGWCIPGKLYTNIVARMMERMLSVSCLPQQVLAEFLRRGYYLDHTKKLRCHFKRSVSQATMIIKEHFPPKTQISSPAGGFILWVTLPEMVDVSLLLSSAKQNGIFIPKSSVFYADGREVAVLRVCICSANEKSIFADLVALGKLACYQIESS